MARWKWFQRRNEPIDVVSRSAAAGTEAADPGGAGRVGQPPLRPSRRPAQRYAPHRCGRGYQR